MKTEPPAATLEYQVLLTEAEHCILASVPDLRCEAIGYSPAEALATVRHLAIQKLKQFEGTAHRPPPSARLSLERIELPAPPPPRPPDHLELVQDVPDLPA
jgi:hypothetical protein